jgi:hypothetical protein
MLPMLAVPWIDTPRSQPQRDLFGASVAEIRDIDGGGKRDLAVGAPEWKDGKRDRGRVWIVSMETGLAIRLLEPDEPHRGFGWTLTALGDVDGKGSGDLAVGAMQWDYVGMTSPSRVFVFDLERPGLLRKHESLSADFIHSWYAYGATPVCCTVGDWNTDACADYAIAHPLDRVDGSTGSVEVISGKNGATLFEWREDSSAPWFGSSLCALPDLDGDGGLELAATALAYKEDLDAGKRASVRVLGSRERRTLAVIRSEHDSGTFGASLAIAPGVEDGDPEQLWIGSPFSEKAVLEVWSMQTWKRVSEIRVDKEKNGSDRRRFASVLLPVSDVKPNGLRGVLATEPESLGSRCFVASSRGLISSSPQIDWSEDSINMARCGVAVGDLDADGVGDFAFGGVTHRGNFPGSVVLWSTAEGKVLRRFTRDSIQPAAK